MRNQEQGLLKKMERELEPSLWWQDKGGGIKLKQLRFRFEIRKSFWTMGVVRPWHRLVRGTELLHSCKCSRPAWTGLGASWASAGHASRCSGESPVLQGWAQGWGWLWCAGAALLQNGNVGMSMKALGFASPFPAQGVPQTLAAAAPGDAAFLHPQFHLFSMKCSMNPWLGSSGMAPLVSRGWKCLC